MSKISKEDRLRVWEKYNCRCAYCGVKLEYEQMQVDHIQAHWHSIKAEEAEKYNIVKGAHDLSNFNPSCRRCNKWKDTFTVEKFREQVQLQVERLKRDSSAFRMALDYDLIKESGKKVKFWYEHF